MKGRPMSSLLTILRKHPRLALLAVLLGPVALFVYFWVYGRGAWSSTSALAEPLPGDDLLLPDDPFVRLQEEVTIDAPIDTVWEVVAQLGSRKGGFYALAWLERLCTFHIFNTFEKVDAWQQVEPGSSSSTTRPASARRSWTSNRGGTSPRAQTPAARRPRRAAWRSSRRSG
ncbi:hypothetical protein [Cellulomonas soli]